MSFGALGTYFEEFLRPRTVRGLSDYLLTGLLPPLEGLYRDDLNALPEQRAIWNRLRNSRGYRHDLNPRAVLLSHAHADHVGYVSLLRSDIPVVTGALTSCIAKAMQDGGLSTDDSQTVFSRPRVPRDGLLVTESKNAVPATPLVNRRNRRLDARRRRLLGATLRQGRPGSRHHAHGDRSDRDRRASDPRIPRRPLHSGRPRLCRRDLSRLGRLHPATFACTAETAEQTWAFAHALRRSRSRRPHLRGHPGRQTPRRIGIRRLQSRHLTVWHGPAALSSPDFGPPQH